MKLLVIIGEYLQINSSANLCHLSYLRGWVEAGHQVTLLSAEGNPADADPAMQIPPEITQYTVPVGTLYEAISRKKKKPEQKVSSRDASASKAGGGSSRRTKAIRRFKRFLRWLYGPHRFAMPFIRRSRRFRSETVYDYVVSVSYPPASHRAACRLLKAKHIRADHWIQIWEDPWYGDIYYIKRKSIFREEKRLLSAAERICYVSPLTLENQKKLFPESAEKMYWQPLPVYYEGSTPAAPQEGKVYGYFGNYTPRSRNLQPFYEAAKQAGIEVNICGDPIGVFSPTENIHIHARLPLDELRPIEDRTGVLVFLCNRNGGQIPGKIYQYSSTEKTILFILDGTEEEKAEIRRYFGQFRRYVFCENTEEDIGRAIRQIENGDLGGAVNRAVEAFVPARIAESILAGENAE